jgi:hypothetical protein
MTDKDITLERTLRVPDGSPINMKPCYLIEITTKNAAGKDSRTEFFIALELPDLTFSSYMKAKGFFTDGDLETIVSGYADIVRAQTVDKRNIIEMYFPWHTVNYMRSLVYNANKNK